MSDNEHLDNLAQIRSLMESSSRFISLSGLSGVSAGVFAMIGAAVVYLTQTSLSTYSYEPFGRSRAIPWWFEIAVAVAVLFCALVSGYYFTSRKAKKKGLKMWTPATRRLLINLFTPLMTGGIICLILIYKQEYHLIAPLTLVFYGLGLINGSKYTLDEIRILGYLEIVLGIISLVIISYSIVFWALGFGILHIVYGLMMYNKYER